MQLLVFQNFWHFPFPRSTAIYVYINRGNFFIASIPFKKRQSRIKIFSSVRKVSLLGLL
uniref:Uncharacterized protein n=1 Tax=Rhizophora mucronata TaxID=61149 RepID=A0A2P2N806_RHIMU